MTNQRKAPTHCDSISGTLEQDEETSLKYKNKHKLNSCCESEIIIRMHNTTYNLIQQSKYTKCKWSFFIIQTWTFTAQ